tara:strand:- start:2149 stop:3222 length:1074 start_codon:yes stop_codon:yes gene_type:complete
MKIRITPDTLEEKRKKKKKKSGGKKDACYHKVRSRYSVWPSAYASGALVKCRKVGAKNWGTGGKKKKKKANESIDLLEDLQDAEEEILATLEKEGGAAGLDPLEGAVEGLDLPEDFDIDEFLEKMEDVIKHEAGDYIEKTGLPLDEGEVVQFPTKERSSENLDLVNQLYADYSELQDVDNKNEIGVILLLNIRQLTEEETASLDMDVASLEDKYGKITDLVQRALKSEVIKLKEAKKKKKRKKAGTESGKESSLRDWFGRKGAKGKKKGWVDCNTCRKDKKTGKKTCKACGRTKGEKRSKYPSCRPTPGACSEKGKGKSWGKKSKKKKTNEAASEYVYGVKNPGRVGNIYKVKVVKT